MKYLKTYKIFENVKTKLDFSNKNLEDLPPLSNSLERLHCYNNKLKSLPKLPESLKELWCSNNQLKSLPKLPDSLEELWCSNNQLKSIPELPKSLERLQCHNNPLECLIPDKFIEYQNVKWLEDYYYPMINSIEGQVKMIKRNPKVVEELENKGILKVNPADINDILKLDEWS